MQVAEQALELAQANREPAMGGLDMRTRHVGYYLVGAGLPALEKRLAVRYPPGSMLRKIGRGAPLATYLGAIVVFTALFTASVVLHAWRRRPRRRRCWCCSACWRRSARASWRWRW